MGLSTTQRGTDQDQVSDTRIIINPPNTDENIKSVVERGQ